MLYLDIGGKKIFRGFIAAALLWPLLHAQAAALGAVAELSAVYTGEIWRNQRGGLRSGSAYLDNLDVTLDVDAEKFLGWQGGRWFACVLYNNGATISATHVGDAQVISNIETVRALRLYEFWYEQVLGTGAASVKVGLYDLNSEFYATDSSALFIHAAHGIGTDFSQSGETGPSIFAITGLAMRLQYQVDERFSWRAVALDAVPGDPDHPERTVVEPHVEEGLISVGEIDFHPGAYRLGWGGWRYSKSQPRINASGNAVSWGSYGFAEFALDARDLDAANVRAFLRGGIAADSVNRFADFIGAGIVVDGSLWGRDDDDVGFALARAHNGSPYRDALADSSIATESHEMAYELSYRFSLIDRIALQPDIQYIVNPDTNPELDNALAIGLRVELTLY